MENNKRISLNRKVIKSIVLFATVLIIATGALVCIQYYFNQMQSYSKQAFNYSRTAANIIDGDRVLGYVETGEKDDYYYEILDFLNVTQYETDLKYYYVFVPYEDDLVYVWDAVNVEGACELGQHEKYMSEKSKAATFEIFCQDPPEKISIQNDKKYGHIASAYSPIFNSSGEPVAVVGVDLSIPGFRKTIILYMLLLDRAKISVTNPEWISKDGLAFIRYPIEKLARAMRKSKSTVKTVLNQLEKHGLIKRVKQGIGKATLIYVYVPEDSILTTPQPENRPPQGQDSGPVQGRKTDHGEVGKLATNKITSSKTIDLNNSNYYVDEEGISL